MVEKAQSGKSHDHAVFVACLNNGIIAHRTAGLSNIGNAAAESTLDIIAERKNASLASAVSPNLLSHSRFCSFVIGSGRRVKKFCQFPSSSTSPHSSSFKYKSIALSRLGRGISARNGRFSTEGCERRCQRSALLPARRVQ